MIAAPNRKAALEAWGSHGDDFATGNARELKEGEALEAALARPGVVLKRPVGSAAELVAAAKPPRKAAAEASSELAPKPPKPRPKPDQGPLDKAEAALETAERGRRDLLREQAREREALDRRQAAAQDEAEKEVERRRAARDTAKARYAAAQR